MSLYIEGAVTAAAETKVFGSLGFLLAIKVTKAPKASFIDLLEP